MITKVFSVYDKAAQAFLPPFFTPTTGMAIRSFTEAVNDPSHQFAKHATDYTLFYLGDFDDANGSFTGPEGVSKLVLALEVVTKQ